MGAGERTGGHPLGIHRVKDSKPRLPQAAEALDNTLPLYDNEILLHVERLNIDAASFVQMEKETAGDLDKIAAIVMGNTRTRGKQQNRVTGSGGMLVGTVSRIGSRYQGPVRCKVGDRVASLVSLTLTPLCLETIARIDAKTHQMEVTGHAILFETGIGAVLPKDIEERVAMAIFDVAGAPATVAHLCKPGATVVVLGGGGKAGILSCVAARKKVGRRGRVIAVEPHSVAAQDLRDLGVCNEVMEIDATDPLAVLASVAKATRGKMGTVVVNVASVPDTEMAALLAASRKGKILYFGMATSFSKVALGAEGIAHPGQLLFGNGYFPGHDRFAIDLVRRNKKLLALFRRRYA